jgi:hypothetical protein
MMGELITGGNIYGGTDPELSVRISCIEKKLNINQPKKPKKVNVSKIPFSDLPGYINICTPKERAIIQARLLKGC